MIISQHDARYLAERARNKHDAAAERLSNRIVDVCIDDIECENANILRSHRMCLINSCRRARRCTGRRRLCMLFQHRRVMNTEQKQAMLDEMYWRVLEAIVTDKAGR